MESDIKKISIVMPVFNEAGTVKQAIEMCLAADTGKIEKEVVVVDDGSTDETIKEIRKVKDKRIKLITHLKNKGKGAAIQTALKEISGDVIVIQDADLEYDPNEYLIMLGPIIYGKADVVFGSRFIGIGPHRVLYFWHMVGNKLLTLMSNALTNINLTDVNTCYKLFTRKVAESIELKENRFGFDPEFTAKVAKENFRIYEVGVSYYGRSYDEGKKISWKDGFRHLYSMFKYTFLN